MRKKAGIIAETMIEDTKFFITPGWFGCHAREKWKGFSDKICENFSGPDN